MKHEVFDLHCDTLSALYKLRERGERAILAKNDLHIDAEKLAMGGYTAQVFAAFVDTACVKDSYEAILAQIDLFDALVSETQELYVVRSGRDLCTARQAGAVAAILAVEDAGVIGADLSRVDELYRRGVRLMTLTWNYPNEISVPNDLVHGRADAAARLTAQGVAVVRRMEQLGMAIDISHLSDGGAYDVLAHTACPVLASHSNARTVCHHVRNLTDDLLYQLGNRCGLVGLNYYDAFLVAQGVAGLEDLVQHAKHIVKVGGLDLLALGSDFDGIPASHALPDASYLPRLCDALARGGFSERQVEAITCGNATRFFQTILR